MLLPQGRRCLIYTASLAHLSRIGTSGFFRFHRHQEKTSRWGVLPGPPGPYQYPRAVVRWVFLQKIDRARPATAGLNVSPRVVSVVKISIPQPAFPLRYTLLTLRDIMV